MISRGDVFPPVHGAAVKIVRTAEAVARLGHKVFFLSDDRGRYHLFHGGRHEIRPIAGGIAGDRMVGQRQEALLAALGVPKDDRFLYSPMFDTGFWSRAINLARENSIEITHAEFPAFLVPALMARAVTGCPTVMVEHNVEYRRIRDSARISKEVQNRLKAWETSLCKMADRVITVSDNDRDILVRDSVRPSKISVISHGVDLENYGGELTSRRRSTRKRLGFDENEKIIIFHGVLNYPPNLHAVQRLALQILPRVLQKDHNARLLVVGDYPPKDLEQGNIMFTGCVAPRDLAGIIAAADVAVVPLVGGGGTRMKILEYFAAGVPVVSTKKGAEGLALSGNELVSAESDREIADAVHGLLEKPKKARALSRRAKIWVKDYGWDDVARQYVKMYREIIRGGPLKT